MPACSTPSGLLALPGMPTTCECLSQWIDLLESPLSGLDLRYARHCIKGACRPAACVVAPLNTSHAAALSVSMAGLPQLVLVTEAEPGFHDHFRVRPPRDADEGTEVIPASACSMTACSWRGVCLAGDGSAASGFAAAEQGVEPRCVCTPAADAPQTDAQCKDAAYWCPNACRRQGLCVQGVCVCAKGYWGLDCSQTSGGAAGSFALLLGSGPALLPGGGPRPRLFVYDLPASLAAWPVALLGVGSDSERLEGALFLEAALRSRHRTLVAEEADFFIIPVHGGDAVRRMRALAYVRKRWAYYNASLVRTTWPVGSAANATSSSAAVSSAATAAAASDWEWAPSDKTVSTGGRRLQAAQRASSSPNHLFPPVCGGSGVGGLPDVRPLMRRARRLQPGQPPGNALPLRLRGLAFLSCSGLHIGQARGELRDDFRATGAAWWLPEQGPMLAPNSSSLSSEVLGLFRPGVDIRVPDSTRLRCAAASASRNRTTVLYWEGAVRREPPERFFPHNVRAEALHKLGSVPGFAMRTSSRPAPNATGEDAARGWAEFERSPTVAWGFEAAQFCLATDAASGAFGSKDAEALSAGCVPVVVADNTSSHFEEVLPAAAFSLKIDESALSSLPDILASASASLSALQEQGACACEVLTAPWAADPGTWHSTAWADIDALASQDTQGAFATLLAVLARRVLLAESMAGALPDPGLAAVAGLGVGSDACALAEAQRRQRFALSLPPAMVSAKNETEPSPAAHERVVRRAAR